VQEHGVAHDGLEIHVVALDRVGLARRRADLEQLAHVDRLDAVRLVEAPAALRRPRRHDGPDHRDRAVDRLEDDVDRDLAVVGHVGRRDGEPGHGHRERDVALGAGSAPQLGHPDEEG
jgi:hypothetical protein